MVLWAALKLGGHGAWEGITCSEEAVVEENPGPGRCIPEPLPWLLAGRPE